MKVSELTKQQLQVLKDWESTESYKILYDLVESQKNSDATLLGKEILLTPNEFEAVKVAFKRCYTTQGMKELLMFPSLAARILDKK